MFEKRNQTLIKKYMELKANMTRKDAIEISEPFGDNPDLYHIGRPSYPDSLYLELEERCVSFDAALDCGAGTGQASNALIQKFHTVVALDRSMAQLSTIAPSQRIYRVRASAEQIPFSDASFDLVCAAESAHWFEWNTFVDEAFRVLRNGGVMAVWCYYLPRVSYKLDQVINELYNITLVHHIDKQRELMIKKYADLDLPGVNYERKEFQARKLWTFDAMISNLRSSSVVNKEIRTSGVDHVDLIIEKLRAAWGVNHELEAIWDISLLVCNRPFR